MNKKYIYFVLAFVLSTSISSIAEETPKSTDEAKATPKTTEVEDVAKDDDKKDKKGKKEKPETVEEFIEEEELTEISGFLNLLHNAETDKYYLVLESSELNKEFIYFPYILNGPQAAGQGGGAIGDGSILEFREFKDGLGLYKKNTKFTFDETKKISQSKIKNIIEAFVGKFEVEIKEDDKYLISADSIFLSEMLTGITPNIPKEYMEYYDLNVGKLDKGKTYVEKHFPASSKSQMADLVKNLRTALGERINGLDWMGEETKVNAQAKLAAFVPKIGYPDEWQDFTGLEIKADDLLGNVIRMREFFRADSASKELQKTDRNRWGMAPQRVNAYYNSSFNEIVFPAAILQPPFFDPNADPAVNYGGIGAVIGHEMGHGFDDQGSKSDANGIQQNWWTDQDRAAFEVKADALAAQYSAYEPIEGNFVNGRNSLGENIGDVGGLSMAYHAYKLSLNGKEAPVIDGVTGDQRFFLAWAQVWREKRTEQSMMSQLKGGTHAPGRYRALAPRNHDAWYAAFNVQPEDALYLAPEDRVRIW